MKYLVKLENPAHPVKPEPFKDAGDARSFFHEVKDSAFLAKASLVAVSATGQEMTLETYTPPLARANALRALPL